MPHRFHPVRFAFTSCGQDMRMVPRPASALILGLATALAGCTLLPPDTGREPSARPPVSGTPPIPTMEDAAVRQCITELGGMGAAFTPVADRFDAPGCSLAGTVQLTAIAADGAPLSLRNIGPVACDVGQAFAAWARYGADRAARAILGAPLVAIETMGSYSCRNVAGSGRRSAHAKGAAVDISAFILADGRRVSIAEGWTGRNEAERQFLRTVHQSACRRFATVLGPDYNAAHRDHLHFEGVNRGRSHCR